MSNVVELSPFYLKREAAISEFLLASDKFQSEFISMQKGYISRKLIVNGEMWSDLVVWETMEDVKNATKIIYENAAALEYIAFIDDEKSSDEDILYYSVEKSY